jgi:hypothetical protein
MLYCLRAFSPASQDRRYRVSYSCILSKRACTHQITHECAYQFADAFTVPVDPSTYVPCNKHITSFTDTDPIIFPFAQL